jgi:hypothetical protein
MHFELHVNMITPLHVLNTSIGEAIREHIYIKSLRRIAGAVIFLCYGDLMPGYTVL